MKLNFTFSRLLIFACLSAGFLLTACADSRDHETLDHAESEPQVHAEDEAHTHDAADQHQHDEADAHAHDEETPHVHEDEAQQSETVQHTAGAGAAHVHAADPDLIELDAKTIELIGLETAWAEIVDLDEVVSATGRIVNNQNREAHVTSLVSGRVNELLADWGETVEKGQPLVCIESIELGEKRAAYFRAQAERDLANADFERKRTLFAENAVAERVLLESEAVKRSAEIHHEYAEKMLLLTGLPKSELLVPSVLHGAVEGCSVHIPAPVSGVVIDRSIVRGEEIKPGICLFKILDVSTVWVEIDLYEKDLRHVRMNGRVKASVPAYPGETFEGRIFYISHTLDEQSRTVAVRCELANADFRLKPGMFAGIEIVTGERKGVLAVPEQAVLIDGNTSFVFTKHDEHFHRKTVETGGRGAGLIEIVAGIEQGTEVVVQGNYQLKSKMMMSGLDPHAGHIH